VGRRPGQRLWVPAVCTLLAVVVLSARVFFQPVVVSYLFLGLTLWLLERPRLLRQARQLDPAAVAAAPHATHTRSLWWLPVLFVLWVNLDQWFLLGLALIALYAVGALLQT